MNTWQEFNRQEFNRQEFNRFMEKVASEDAGFSEFLRRFNQFGFGRVVGDYFELVAIHALYLEAYLQGWDDAKDEGKA